VMETLRLKFMICVEEEVPEDVTRKSGKEGNSGGGVFCVP